MSLKRKIMPLLFVTLLVSKVNFTREIFRLFPSLLGKLKVAKNAKNSKMRLKHLLFPLDMLSIHISYEFVLHALIGCSSKRVSEKFQVIWKWFD